MISELSHKCAILLLSVSVLFLSSCNTKDKRFELMDSSQTGIDFMNNLEPTPELNIFNYLYFYDGAGVAAGDFTGDGLPDLYFASNQGENKLYLNEGDFEFRDVTTQAFNTSTSDWSTGVTIVDINDDGLLDIYVSNVGGYLELDGRNQLFINMGLDEEGVPQFEEQAEDYGLDFQGLATQAVFFDYDLDGDLDMYMMNHSVHSFDTYTQSTLREESHPIAGDRLLRNDGGTFTEVTEEAGIFNSALGYGLGIAVTDFNQDGYPDIYIGNDFHEDDYIYINNGDGTFTESLGEMINHTSYSSMGNDVVDINNDGLIDIFSLDMLPDNYEMRQAAAEDDPLDIYSMKQSYGFKHKFSRNTLQLNRGNGKFSEIGKLAGVHATDWSWAALGADFNNSGYVDLFVSNGIRRRTNDLDYINYISDDEIQNDLRGTIDEDVLKLAENAPSVKIPNYMFANDGTLFFDDVSEKWGLNQPTFSSGAVYVDLNNDGDLDLVVNNVDQEASVYRNVTREKFPAANYIKLKFEGPEGNRFGIGTTISIPLEKDKVLTRELFLSRGFQSAVEPVLHVGLDSLDVIPELHIKWPDGNTEILENVSANQQLTLNYEDDSNPQESESEDSDLQLFEEITEDVEVDYKHEENSFVEFNREALIPHMVSREGPALAIGDVNGDGLDDFYAGGARRQNGALFLQQDNGTFLEKTIPDFEEDNPAEDVDAHFADFTGNGALDLLVVSGGNEYSGTSEYMLPRLYVNDGEGNLTRDTERIPEIFLTGSVAAVADVNDNGLSDIFIGARTIPWRYGEKPTSYLLLNQGDGFFEVDESEFGERFSDLGLVTDAKWTDMDDDGLPDLVVASEWSDIKIIYNTDEAITNVPNSSGIWNTVSVADLNNDDRPDILAGNLGLNSKFKASENGPIRMYVNDFDDNGSKEQIVTYVDEEGEERLFARKDELGEQLPYIHEQFESYTGFANASLDEVIDQDKLNDAIQYSVTDLSSSVFYSEEDDYRRESLPVTSQFSPIQNFLTVDVNGDGAEDVINVGNYYDANIQRGRYDAHYGEVLLNDGSGILTHLPNREYNWYLEGQIRKVDLIEINGQKVMVTAENNGSLRFFRILNTEAE